MPTIANAPSGENTNPDGTVKIPISGSKFVQINNLFDGAPAQGEVIYFNGTEWKRLGVGTSGQVLTTGGAGANPAWATPVRYIALRLNSTNALTTSDKFYFRIPAGLNGMDLISVAGSVGTGAAGSSSSGTPTFTVKNVTDNNQMLSTSLTIDANEYTSATAATPAVIDTTKDDVVTDDLIELAVTTAGTGVTYAQVTLGFRLP